MRESCIKRNLFDFRPLFRLTHASLAGGRSVSALPNLILSPNFCGGLSEQFAGGAVGVGLSRWPRTRFPIVFDGAKDRITDEGGALIEALVVLPSVVVSESTMECGVERIECLWIRPNGARLGWGVGRSTGETPMLPSALPLPPRSMDVRIRALFGLYPDAGLKHPLPGGEEVDLLRGGGEGKA